MDMAAVLDGAIAADAGIITGGAEAVTTSMVGGIIAITGNLTCVSSERPPGWRPLSRSVAQAMSPIDTSSSALKRLPCADTRHFGRAHAHRRAAFGDGMMKLLEHEAKGR